MILCSSRRDLLGIIQASEVAEQDAMLKLADDLVAAGIYGEAMPDEIELFMNALDELDAS